MSEAENIAILVGNLPSDVQEDDVLDALEGLGYELSVSLKREGDAEKVLAVVRFDGMTRGVAEKLAQRIQGMLWRDRTLTAYVPLFFD